MLMFKIIMVTLLVRRRSSSIVVSKVDNGAGEGVVADHAVQGHLMMRMMIACLIMAMVMMVIMTMMVASEGPVTNHLVQCHPYLGEPSN